MENERQLVESAKSGNDDAFIELANLCKESVARIAFYIIGSRDEAEEIAADAFLKAYLSIKTLRDDVPFSVWVARIAKNLSIDKLRRKKSFQRQTEDSKGSDDEEMAMDIRKEVMDLPIKLRLPLTMLYYDSMQIEDISKILGIPQGTVKSRIFLAKERLKRRLS